MGAYILRRLVWLPILLIAVSVITFALGLYGPGDPVLVMLGQHVNPEAAERVRHELGLDRPFVVQYMDYVQDALHGDFGESLKYRGQPVGKLIAQRLWVTVQLNAVVMALGIVLGIPLGVVAAVNRNTWLDYLTVTGAVAGRAVPAFATAPILLWFLAARFHILPSGGWDGIMSKKIILPVMVMATGPIAVFVRQTRANMIDVLNEEYVRTARSKGLRERIVIFSHALRNALIPLATIFGLMAGSLVSGSFLTETIFGIPGIGRLAVDSFFARDYPVIMATTLLIAVSYTVVNLLVDIGYGYLDPRIRYGD